MSKRRHGKAASAEADAETNPPGFHEVTDQSGTYFSSAEGAEKIQAFDRHVENRNKFIDNAIAEHMQICDAEGIEVLDNEIDHHLNFVVERAWNCQLEEWADARATSAGSAPAEPAASSLTAGAASSADAWLPLPPPDRARTSAPPQKKKKKRPPPYKAPPTEPPSILRAMGPPTGPWGGPIPPWVARVAAYGPRGLPESPPRKTSQPPHTLMPDTDFQQEGNLNKENRRRRKLRNSRIKDLLQEGRTITFRSEGWSLWPKVSSMDATTYEPVKSAEDVGETDIVFCEVQPGDRFCARMVKSKWWDNYDECYHFIDGTKSSTWL